MQTSVAIHPSAITELRALDCPVIVPGDDTYDDTRAVYFTALSRRPAVIVQPRTALDVARAVRVARATGLEIAVRAGGHSLAGHSVCEGGMVLDLRRLDGLEINGSERIARAGGGLTAGAYTKATGAHGLVTGFGDAPSVGVAGITLAGGVGFLHRRYGLTIDNVLGAQVVTADGRLLEVNERAEPDLFWAIRGGGGNFGVVTRFDYRLHELDRVLGGMLMLPASAERLVGYLHALANAPDELCGIVNVMPAPPMPFLPEELHGRPIIMAVLVCTGPLDRAEQILAPFREGAAADMIGNIQYPQIYDGHENAPHPPAMAVHSTFVDAIDDDTAEGLLERLVAGTAPMRVVQFRPLGGAVARVSDDATAFAHRRWRFVMNVAAAYHDPAQRDVQQEWADSTARLAAGRGGAYTAFLGGDGPRRMREAYPEATWRRLARIKSAYDPSNLFRGNHNITPADGVPA